MRPIDRIEEDCPECGGELQRQDQENLQCLGYCREPFAHYRHSDGTHVLENSESEVVRRV
jgi:hypothetical protein